MRRVQCWRCCAFVGGLQTLISAFFADFWQGRTRLSHPEPLAHGADKYIVVVGDEAAPIDAAVETITRHLSAGEFRAKDLAVALQRMSELVYAPLARLATVGSKVRGAKVQGRRQFQSRW